MSILNIHGEFPTPDDSEEQLERRRKVYANCCSIDTSKLQGNAAGIAAGKKSWELRGVKVERTCDWCHKPLVGRKDKKYCSDECREKMRNHRRAKKGKK